jgi:hypothetical protein
MTLMSKTLRQKVFEDTGFDHLNPINIARDRKLRALYEPYANATDEVTKKAAYEKFRQFVMEEYCEPNKPGTTDVD